MSKHVKGQISLYIDGMLKDAELKAFEAHVKTCGECANALAGTKRAVAAAGKTKEQPLPVNFYAKLNQKLDAVDAEKNVFNWPVFMRSAAAICTMLIVGVFVYNIKNQTNNFSDVRMKQDSQMPKGQALETQANAVPAAASKPAVMALKKKVIPVEQPESKDKSFMDLAVKTPSLEFNDELTLEEKIDSKAVLNNFSEPAAEKELQFKYETGAAFNTWGNQKNDTKKVEQEPVAVPRKAKVATAPAAKMQEASAASGGMAAVAASDAAAPLAEEEANEMLQPNESGPQTFVFKDEKAWQSYATGNGVKEPSVIDWTQQMVVAVFLSARPTEGYRVEIVNVEFSADRVVVYYKEHEPMLGSINAQVITYPHREKVVKKSGLPVEFKEVK